MSRKARQFLYRASDKPETSYGAHFTPDEEAARAYLDDPGFGGACLFRYDVEVDPRTTADARGDDTQARFEALAELAGYADPDEKARQWRDDGLYWVFHVLDDAPAVERRLRDLGYVWVIYDDDFPEGAETWRFIGQPADAPKVSERLEGCSANPSRLTRKLTV